LAKNRTLKMLKLPKSEDIDAELISAVFFKYCVHINCYKSFLSVNEYFIFVEIWWWQVYQEQIWVQSCIQSCLPYIPVWTSALSWPSSRTTPTGQTAFQYSSWHHDQRVCSRRSLHYVSLHYSSTISQGQIYPGFQSLLRH